MRAQPCVEIRQQLEAFHDGELGVEQRVAIDTHLQECASCAWEARALSAIAGALRAEAPRRVSQAPDLLSMRTGVVARVQAEREAALPARVARMFDDLHLVWAGLAAAAATATCAALLVGLWFFSPPERADSLAGLLSALASPGSDRNPVSLDLRMSLPRVNKGLMLPDMLASSASEEDLVFALAAVVTQEGRIARSEVIVSNHRDADEIRLMNAINGARFEPASLSGSPVAVNFVWLLTHTTVRGTISRHKIHS